MIVDDEWEEPRLFLAEQTHAIRRELAVLMVPLLLIAAAFAVLGWTARDKPQLAVAQDVHMPGLSIDRH
jgi:hypothetical protein